MIKLVWCVKAFGHKTLFESFNEAYSVFKDNLAYSNTYEDGAVFLFPKLILRSQFEKLKEFEGY